MMARSLVGVCGLLVLACSSRDSRSEGESSSLDVEQSSVGARGSVSTGGAGDVEDAGNGGGGGADGACASPCALGQQCSGGSCVSLNVSVIPWGEAAATHWPDPASAPDGLIITEGLDAKLFIEQELAAETGGETAGFLFLHEQEMTFSFDPRPFDIPLESIWHTHPGGTSFSPYDIGNWGSDPADWGQWATVRSSRGYTYVLLVTDATPTGLKYDDLVSENDLIRSDIFDYFIQEFGHPNDIEASHWSVFEMARRYDWVYYLGTPGSLVLERVTTAGPTNWPENPGGYPLSLLAPDELRQSSPNR